MKIMKLFYSTAAACLVAAFVSGAAQAQESVLQTIVDNYCDGVAEAVVVADGKLEDASADLAVCSEELDTCVGDVEGVGNVVKSSQCIRNYSRCTKIGIRERASACRDFLGEWVDETKLAERRARFNWVLVEFNTWLQGDSSAVDTPTVDQCFVGAFLITDECTGE